MQQKATGGEQSAKKQAGAEHKAAQQAIQAFQGLDTKPLTPAAPTRTWWVDLLHKPLQHLRRFRRCGHQHPQQMSAESPVVTIRRMP